MSDESEAAAYVERVYRTDRWLYALHPGSEPKAETQYHNTAVQSWGSTVESDFLSPWMWTGSVADERRRVGGLRPLPGSVARRTYGGGHR